jgi:hypothetical protein
MLLASRLNNFDRAPASRLKERALDSQSLNFSASSAKTDHLIRVLLHREMQPQRLLRYRQQSRAADSYLDLPRHRLPCLTAKKFNSHAGSA